MEPCRQVSGPRFANQYDRPGRCNKLFDGGGSGVQRFFADDWPARLWMRVVPLAVPAAVCWWLEPLPWLLDHWPNAVLFVGLLVLAWGVGWYGALIPGWLVLGPLYYSQGLKNGAPFRAGEHVKVLTRRHRGRVAQVCEVWAERDQLRVELGEAARVRFEDVFWPFEVCREPRGDVGDIRRTSEAC
jgi:hypothetical protein